MDLMSSSSGKAVVMSNIVKVYPDGTVALRGVNFELSKGEIHGLLGENGAGKTTLMKILSGLLKPTKGEIFVKGSKVVLKSASHALSLGIGMVHQHLSLVPVFTGYENIVLGIKGVKPSRKDIEELMRKVGLEAPLDVAVEDLPLGVRQRIEILKMLVRNVDVLILDEPTTNLTPIETRELFKSLRVLKEYGKTIVFITHKLREAMEVTDRITVLRRGKVVGTVKTSETNPVELAKMMVGREVVFSIEKMPKEPQGDALKVEDLWVMSDLGTQAVKGVSFNVRFGEIFGIAGVEGNGQTELVEAIAGLRNVVRGRIYLDNVDITHKHTKDRYSLGLAYIPEDRVKTALAMDMSVVENSILSLQWNNAFVNKLLSIKWSEARKHADRIVKKFDVLVKSLDSPVKSLSGGNQQKLVVGRELSKEPKVIVAAQPTRGLDVGATEYIRKLLIQLRDAGKAVLLVSSDLDEVLTLSDRVAVMYEGKIMGVVDPSRVSEEVIGMMMGGYTLDQVRGLGGV